MTGTGQEMDSSSRWNDAVGLPFAAAPHPC